METLDDVLAHYGIPGMKWGVRRSRRELKRARRDAPSKLSEDARRAERAKEKVKKTGLSSLSNQEIEQLTKRLKLEQQYANLVPAQTNRMARGQSFIKKTLEVGTTVNQAISFANSPAGKMVRNSIKESKKSKK